MYGEEYLGEDAYDEETEVSSIESSSSLNTEMKERYKILEKNKRSNPYYNVIKVLINGEIKKIETYSTPILCNAYIRHAISGAKCPHRSGSRYEDLYFKVADTTSSIETRQLYYYSPEEFERHNYTILSQSIKDDWHIKSIRANLLYNK